MTPWTVACQATLSIGFPKQEYWNGLPFPPAGDLPDPGIALESPKSLALAGGFFTTEPPEKDRQIIDQKFSHYHFVWSIVIQMTHISAFTLSLPDFVCFPLGDVFLLFEKYLLVSLSLKVCSDKFSLSLFVRKHN